MSWNYTQIPETRFLDGTTRVPYIRFVTKMVYPQRENR